MPNFPKRPEFVVVVDTKNSGNTVKINDQKELEAFLYNFSNSDLAKCIWDSLLFSYKQGVKSGLKKAGAPVTE